MIFASVMIALLLCIIALIVYRLKWSCDDEKPDDESNEEFNIQIRLEKNPQGRYHAYASAFRQGQQEWPFASSSTAGSFGYEYARHAKEAVRNSIRNEIKVELANESAEALSTETMKFSKKKNSHLP